MNALKITTITTVLLLVAFIANGQSKIKYRHVKDNISLDNYREVIDQERYSPLIAAACNYLLPSAGYFYVGESLRGVAVFGSEITTSMIFTTGLVLTLATGPEIESSVKTNFRPIFGRVLLFTGIFSTGLIQLWSIYDVVKIAKVKNIANCEQKISMSLQPSVEFINLNNTNFNTLGLKLQVSF